ncbi:MAG: TIM barrel protein [Candidatus Omnitrophota bacterium]
MVKLSVCIEMFWKNLAPEEKIKKVKDSGFKAFEFWGWKNKELKKVRAAKEETGLEVAAFCTEPNSLLVERGYEKELTDGLVESAEVARSLGCKRLIVTTGNCIADETFEATRRRVVRKLKGMSKIAKEEGVILVLEPLNPVVDHKGYWLTRMAEAADIVQEVSSPNLKILDDLYHQQRTEGNLIDNLTLYAPVIGHFHVAGVPGRHELVGGELDYRGIFAAIDKTGYDGYIGLEFSPTTGDETALRQVLTLI